jgi:hypothetical protein
MNEACALELVKRDSNEVERGYPKARDGMAKI